MAITKQTTVYSDIQDALDRAVAGDVVGAHGPFWRNLDRNAFVEHKVFGRPLLVVGNSADSNLIKALRAQVPFGKDVGTVGATTRRMPAGLPPAAEADIAIIEAWIDANCPA